MTSNAIEGIGPTEVTERLKEVIRGVVNSPFPVDFETMPLPQEMIQRERMSQVALPSPYPPPTPIIVDIPSRKRTSSEFEAQPARSTTPPWLKRDAKATPAQSKRAEKKQKKAAELKATAETSKFNDLEKRRQRFELSLRTPAESPSVPNTPIAGPVVGTCQTLEKSYLRLTDAPKPETVRPLEVLMKSLDLIISKWKVDHNYGYVCDQFKSMRQDLTVQRIKNSFTVRVYEAHARIALERSDLGEYNQCQSQLKQLYKQKLGGHPGEFTAYRILYMIHTRNRTGMNDMLAELTNEDKKHPAVQHALEVRSALATDNYYKFFKLYEDPPNMGAYLMDMFVHRERIKAMSMVSRAYKPDVKVQYLAQVLSFANQQECAQFICDIAGEEFLQTKNDEVYFLAPQAAPRVLASRASALRSVDIKGQI